MEIGSFLSARRKKLGLSLSEVGAVLGYTPQAVYRYEKGIVNIDLSIVDSFCKALNLSIDAFFSMKEDSLVPYSENEKFDELKFRSILEERLKDASIEKKICSRLSISASRLKKWVKGTSLPSVNEFLSLADILGYRPADLYLGKVQEGKETPLHAKNAKGFRGLSFSLLGTIAIGCLTLLLAVIACSYLLSHHGEINQTSDSSNKATRMCSVSIQGYDIEDKSKIDSLSYHYNVKQGQKLDAFLPTSSYYDFVKLSFNDKDFDISITPIQNDLDLVAYFTKKTFEVSFLGYEDELLYVCPTKYLSDAVAPTSVADCGDFRFAGWKEPYSCVKSDLKIHSYFTRFRGNLHLDFNGGESNGATSKLIEGYTSSSFALLPAPTKRGHEFLFYEDEKGNEFTTASPLKSELTYLKAIYRPLTYTLSFGSFSSCSVTYGEKVTSLPNRLDGRIVIGYKKGDTKISLPFVYLEASDLALEPIFADEYFDYEIENGSLTLKKVKQCDSDTLDLTNIGDYEICHISSDAVSNLEHLASIKLGQSKLTLEANSFHNLPSLKRVEFPNLTSESTFAIGVFSDCPSVNYLLTGNPRKTQTEPLQLKDYGLEGGEDFIVEFNSVTKEMPLSWNEDFGTIGEFRMGDGLIDLNENQLVTKGSKVLRFTPGKNDYFNIRLDLPDIEQDEMNFSGTCLIRIVGEKFGKVKRFSLENGGVSVLNRTKPLIVDEFDASKARFFPMREQKVLANKVILSDQAIEGEYGPATSSLEVEFHGCEVVPSTLSNQSAFLNKEHTSFSFYPEKLYDPNETIDYPIESLSNW